MRRRDTWRLDCARCESGLVAVFPRGWSVMSNFSVLDVTLMVERQQSS
jgi:hypothetical protein